MIGSKRQQKKDQGKKLEVIDKMIEQLKQVRTAIEYDKKEVPYFFMTNYSDQDGRLGTYTVGNMGDLIVFGILQQFIVSNIVKNKSMIKEV